MPKYDFTALDKQGEQLSSQVEADSLNIALGRIRQMGLFPIEVIPESGKKRLRFSFNLGSPEGRFGAESIMLFTRQLSVLTDAGMPLVRSLHTLLRQSRFVRMKPMINDMIRMIESGRSFSEALAGYTRTFSNVYVNMIRAGETGGALDLVLQRLADYQERNLRLSRKIQSALIYPLVVLAAALVILSVIIIYIVPRFTELFLDMNLSLPWITRQLIFISDSLRTHWYLFILAAGGGFGIYRVLMGVDWIRFQKDRLKLKVPVFGPLTQKIIAARFARTLATLLVGGVPILQALKLGRQISGNEEFARTIDKVETTVREGGMISRVMEESRVFPELMTNMIAIGEESGSLDQMLIKVADTYEDEVEMTANSLTALLEPILISVLGVIVGIIVLAMFLPMVSLIQSLSQ